MKNQNSVAYISKINELSSIEGADKIVLAKVEGWTSIVQKGIHKVGDMILCITTDAVIPEKLAEKWGVASYLRKGNRVRTVKLRGVYSECILIPFKDLPKGKYSEGDDMMEALDIFKYEPPAVIIHLPGNKTKKQRQNINFSIYYKFPNIKNVPNIFNEEDDVVVSRKIHGTNSRFGVCLKPKLSLLDRIKILFGNKSTRYCFCYGSHNVLKGDSLKNSFYAEDVWGSIAKKFDIESKLWSYCTPLIESNSLGKGIILYGEIYGQGIQGEKYNYGLSYKDLVLFDIEFDGFYVNRSIFEKLCTFYFQLPMVEKLYQGKYSKEIINNFVENNYIEGTRIPHEGVVVSCITGDRHKIAKIINSEYLMFAVKNEVPDSH